MRDTLRATSAFVNCTNGANGDNPTEITRADIDGLIRRLRGNNAMSFVSGTQGENRFGTAPVRRVAHYKLFLIDLELLAA